VPKKIREVDSRFAERQQEGQEVITMARTKQADNILGNGDAQLGADIQGDASERAIKVGTSSAGG
jgi:hypothetical protein